MREWAVATTHFTGDAQGNVKKLHGIRVGPAPKFEPIPGIGIHAGCGSGAARDGLHRSGEAGAWSSSLDVKLDARGNIAANEQDYQTSVPGVFAAGDARRGQSLVVWAIAEGRKAAESVDRWLKS